MKKLIIKFIRKNRGIKQQELANKIGINRSYLSAIETGKMIPSIDILLAISRQLNCMVTDLYDQETLKQIKN